MVMEQMRQSPARDLVLVRGQYDQPGEKVQPGTPASLPPLPPGAPRDRLGLARWLVDPQHPLTARVTVNRFWKNLMGTGIVKTLNDFGSQGEWPSHPELLDWLATRVHRQRLGREASGQADRDFSTYRQSAKLTPELQERDPENRLYARGPRFRLGAEEIRDTALAVSGLLARRSAVRVSRRISRKGCGRSSRRAAMRRSGPRRSLCRATARIFTAARFTPFGSGPAAAATEDL